MDAKVESRNNKSGSVNPGAIMFFIVLIAVAVSYLCRTTLKENLHLREYDWVALVLPFTSLFIIVALMIDRWANGKLLGSVGESPSGIFFRLRSESVVQGAVYAGAAILIVVVGLRGIRVIASSQTTPIVLAIGLEFCMLLLLAYAMVYGRRDHEGGVTYVAQALDLTALREQVETLAVDVASLRRIVEGKSRSNIQPSGSGKT
jgi:hypothetical protein